MRMDPVVKIALTACVLLAGISAATLFRGESPRAKRPSKPSAETLLIRSRIESAPSALSGGTAQSAPRHGAANFPPFERPATVVTPLDRRESPPPLSAEYPAERRPAPSRWGASMEMMLPVVAPDNGRPRIHRIVDGDTLAALAERYLGSADRAKEIFEANRDVLAKPELLPIVADIRIPAR